MRRLAVVLLLLALPAWAQTPKPAEPYARDLAQLTQWFEGQFDDYEQVWFETDARSAYAGEKHERIHATHARLGSSPLGENAFYVEEYLDNDPAKVFRQRIVTFAADPAAGGIRMKLWFPKDAKSLLGAASDTKRADSVGPGQASALAGCDIVLKRVGGQFEGGMEPKACQFGEGDKKRWSQHDIVLSSDKYWRLDRTIAVADGQVASGRKDGVGHHMRRANSYTCSIDFLGDKPGQPVQEAHGLKLHDQSGIAAATRTSDGKTVSIRLRNRQYAYYAEGSDFLVLQIVDDPNDERSLAYGIAEAGSARIGAAVPWVRAHCNRDDTTNRKPMGL